MAPDVKKLDDRLRNLEVHTSSLLKMTEEIRDLVRRHDKMIYGNGQPGIVTKLDRLEQKEESRKWVFRGIIGTSVVFIVKLFWDALLSHK